jgi:EmrB/QacA subfamily drug resistance transporter
MTTANRKYALWISGLASFLTPFLGSSLNIALPGIGHEFNLTAVELTWIPTAYILSNVIFLVPFGRLADIKGRKRIFTVGICIDVIACIVATMTPSGRFFILLRGFQGLGGAMIFSTGLAILTSVYPAEERGRVLGINVASVYSGLSLGPVIGGFLTHNFGWRSVFFANILIGITIIVLVTTKLKGEWADAKGEKYDWPGNLLYSFAFIFLMAGLSSVGSKWSFLLIGGGIAAMVAFVARELRISHPILDLRLFRITQFAFSNLAALVNYCATFAIGLLLSLYLQDIKSFDPQRAGLILLAQPVIMALFSPYAGRLSDKIEPRIVASLGMTFTTIGLGVFCFIDQSTELSVLLTGLIIVGVGFALFSSPNTNAIMSSVEKRFLGTASGLVGTMRLTGQLLSMGIATLTFSHYLGSRAIEPGSYPLFLQAVRTAFILFTLLCFAGIFASLARGKVRDQSRPRTHN